MRMAGDRDHSYQNLLDTIADIVREREDQAWRAQAACKGKTDWFFPVGVGVNLQHYDAAKQLCRKCPVSTECGDYFAENATDKWRGMWAGRTVRSRTKVAV